MEKVCERCGKSFSCTHDINCWCMTVPLTMKVKDYISGLYDDCLCETCIQEINAMSEPPK